MISKIMMNDLLSKIVKLNRNSNEVCKIYEFFSMNFMNDEILHMYINLYSPKNNYERMEKLKKVL